MSARRVAMVVMVLSLACGCGPSTPPASTPRDSTSPAPVDSTALIERDSADGAASVVRAYYEAINQQRFDEAYRLWARGGTASGKSLAEFRAGFARTAAVEVQLGVPGRIEGAAGSRFVEIPLRVTAVATEGERKVYTGSYTLRRSEVDGATAEQRAWRIDSARLR